MATAPSRNAPVAVTPNWYNIQKGDNPFPPSAAEVERLRAAISAMAHQDPTATSLMNNMCTAQRSIAKILNTRASLMDQFAIKLETYESQRAETEAAKVAGLPVSFAAIDYAFKTYSDDTKAVVADLDAQIAKIQETQAEMFVACQRCVPSFS